MTRSITQTARNIVEASESGDVFLWFATITHSQLATPIRVVTESFGSVSYRHGEIVNYMKGGLLYLGCPFMIEWLTDNEQLPRGRVSVPDPTREIGLEALRLVDTPQFKIELYRESDWSSTFDYQNARLPTGTPTQEAVADFLYLQNVQGDAIVVTADIVTIDYNTEPWPAIRSTPDRLPWINK